MPRLSIDIEAKYAQLIDGLKSISKQADTCAKSVESSFALIKKAAALVGIGLGFSAIVKQIDGAIASMAGLHDAALRTGASIEGLSAIKGVAKLTGTDFESAISGLQKLSKAQVAAQDTSSKTAEAFKAIGIPLDGIAKRRPDELFLAIAKQLDKFSDVGKPALAMLLFGKAGADLLPILKALAEKGDLVGRVTEEQARQADEYTKNLIRLNSATTILKAALAAELLPALDAITGAMVAAKNDSGLLAAAWAGLGGLGAFLYTDEFADNATKAKKQIQEIRGEIANLDRAAEQATFGGWLQRKLLQFKTDGKTFDVAKAELVEKLAGAQKELDLALNPPKPAKDKPKPDIVVPTGVAKTTDGSDAERKKILEGQIKELERFADAEAALLAHEQEFLQIDYQQNLVSLADYAAKRQSLQDKTLAVQASTIDKEIAQYRASRNKGNESDRADVDNKIEALQDKKAKLQATAAFETKKQAGEATLAYHEFLNTLQDINITLLEQQGRLAEAAKLRYTLSHESIIQKITTERDSAVARGDTGAADEANATLAKEESLKRLATAQGTYNELSIKATTIRATQTAEEERSAIAVAKGTETQEQSILRIVAAREVAIAALTANADAQQLVADTTSKDTAENTAALESVKAFRLEIEKLAADTEQLATSRDFSAGFDKAFREYIDQATNAADQGKKVFDIASQTIGDGFYDALQGNFKNVGTDFKRLIDRMVADWLAAQALMKLKELATEYGPTILKAFGAAAAAADGAVFQGGNVIPFAGGGIVSRPTVFPMRGGMGLMAEAGPEAVMPLRRGPDGKLGVAGAGGGPTIVIQQSFAPGTDKRTIDQAAQAVGQVSQRAMRRNG